MKTKMLFLASAFAILASGSSGAVAEGNSDACHNQYGACMERCATRPQSLQEGCSSSCESSTNACYTQMYSQQSGGQGGGTTQYRSEEGRDARRRGQAGSHCDRDRAGDQAQEEALSLEHPTIELNQT
jgi:hypothetical protein